MSNTVLTMLTAAIFAVQAAPNAPAISQTNTKRPIMLTGCVRQDETPGSYTFSDVKTGTKYRLSGIGVENAAKRGEIVVGSGARRVTIRGGLVPSATAAAQAGVMDPAQAAVASMSSGANRDARRIELPEFRVVRMQGLSGSCP